MTCANVLVGLGENREGMETGDAGWEGGDAAICVAPRRERPQTFLGGQRRTHFNPRSGAARHIALHELLGTQYACQEDHFELQQTAEKISQIP